MAPSVVTLAGVLLGITVALNLCFGVVRVVINGMPILMLLKITVIVILSVGLHLPARPYQRPYRRCENLRA